MSDILRVRKDLTLFFGGANDGVIGLPGLTDDGRVIEISYFFGAAKPKNIVVISSQVGCPLRCAFCELGREKFVRNLTAEELRDQALLMLAEAKLHGFDDRALHKITVANSGEPLLNPELVGGLEMLAHLPASFKVSTVFPAARSALANIERLAEFAAGRPEHRHLQLQISLISTSEAERAKVSGGRVADFQTIRRAADAWRTKNPSGRKINLSLMLTSDMSCDAETAASRFPPELFRFRFREYVPTRNGDDHRLAVLPSDRLAAVMEAFAARGYDVGRWASPTPIERRFGLAGNVIRRMYLEMLAAAND